MLLELGLTPNQIRGTKFYQAVGCSRCNITGYRGRIPIFELVAVKPTLRDAITRGDSIRKLKTIAKRNKFVPFINLLREYLRRGKTSVEEALPYLLDN